MEAKDDETYMNWWGNYGEMADCNVEYPAWKAGRAHQHQFEKSAQPTLVGGLATPSANEEGLEETPAAKA